MCAVCDKPGPLETFRGYAMHRACAPTHWVKDQADQARFMGRVRAGGWWTNRSFCTAHYKKQHQTEADICVDCGMLA